MTTKSSTLPSLATALYGFVSVAAVLFGLGTTYIIVDSTRTAQDQALAEAVDVRGQHAALAIARTLQQDWTDLQGIARELTLREPEALQLALDVQVGQGTRVSWAGFATPDGRVVASSNGLLAGADVGARPWFQRGLDGPFAGDVHEAVLLNTLLGGSTEEPLRFIDLAAQVPGPDGAVAGVLAFHINFAWAKAFLTETAESLKVDLFLVNQIGDVIIATDGSAPGASELEVFRLAAAGVAHTGDEMWPDGQRYFSRVIPQVAYGDLPSFGWRLVARISPDALEVARQDLMRTVASALSVAGLVLLVLTVLFSRMFIRPVADLAENARRIAAGADEYPLESRSSAEVFTLSGALAILQGRRG